MLVDGIIFGLLASFVTVARSGTVEVLVEAGSQAVLPCKCSTGSCHPASVIWSKYNEGTVWRKERSGLQYWGSNWSQKDGQRVQCPHSQFDKGDYSLQIERVKEEDGGLYLCSIEFRTHIVTTRVMLRIIKVSANPLVPTQGDDVSVSCTVTPWPKGAFVNWILNNEVFIPTTGVISNGDGSVVKDKATERLTGTWTCIVNYTKVGRASTTLSVAGIIQPPKDDTKLYAALGSTFTLPCAFSPGLSPTKMVWEKLEDGNSVTPKSRDPSMSSSDTSFRIQEVVLDDSGRYRCAGNVKGQVLSRTMQLVVAQIIQRRKRDSVMLSCQVTDSSEIKEYEWVPVTYDLNGTESAGPVQKGQTVTLKNSWGGWTCRYYGRDGILGNVTYQVPMMSGQSGQKSSAFSSNVGTVTGLSFLLLILLLVLAQMYKNHQRRKRIFQYPALETIVHTISNEQEEKERRRVKE